MEESQLLKYILGELDASELPDVLEWINRDLENKKEYARLKNSWALASNGKKVTDEKLNIAYSEFRSKNFITKSPIIGFANWFLRYAAAFLIAIALGVIGNKLYVDRETKMNLANLEPCLFVIPAGQMANVVLPDGSKVLLNAGSTLSYLNDFNKDQRVVSLKGEAYFNVAHDQERPFIVQTDGLNLKVYGTIFNVSAYPEDKSILTTLIEGSVGLQNINNEELVRLKAGEMADFNYRNGSLLIKREVNTEMYTSWSKGIITFRNETLKRIVSTMERWYNVEIEFKNEEVGEMIFSGTILKSKPVDQILEVIKISSGVNYTIVTKVDQPNKIYLE